MNITSSRVLLIGATGGIGQKIAAVLQSAGANLLLVGRNISKLDQLKSDIEQGHEYKPRVIAADITTVAGRDSILEAVNYYPGGINVLINCAGMNNFGLFEKLDEKTILKVVDTNLTAPLHLIQMMLPKLKQQPSAHILNIGSTFGSIGYAGFSVYCASKFALRGFTEALRRELADTSITVSYVAPRATNTELNSSAVFFMNRELNIDMDLPEIVAERVLETLISGSKEVYLGWPERFFIKLNSLFPRLVDKALKKQLPVIKRHAGQTTFLN